MYILLNKFIYSLLQYLSFVEFLKEKLNWKTFHVKSTLRNRSLDYIYKTVHTQGTTEKEEKREII